MFSRLGIVKVFRLPLCSRLIETLAPLPPHLFHFEPDGASFVGYVFGQVVAIAADDA